MQPVIMIAFIALAVVIGIVGYLSALKRREAMMAVAAKLGLSFHPHKDRGLARNYRFLNKLRSGSNRYAFNILSGNYQGHDVILFDYHYQTGSGKDTHHHYLSCFILHLTARFPELVIGPEVEVLGPPRARQIMRDKARSILAAAGKKGGGRKR